MVDAKIASALKKVILNSHFRKKVSVEEQKDRFLRGRQIAFMIYEYFQVTSTHEAILDYSDLFGIALQGDDIQNSDLRWDEVSVSISHVPNDGILECLYKMRTRESDQLTTVLARK